MKILYITHKPIYPTIDGGCIAMDSFLKCLLNIEANVDHICISTKKHPFKKKIKLIKRVTKIKNSKLFVEGDNKNILCSDDSHQFGYINSNNIISLINGNSW